MTPFLDLAPPPCPEPAPALVELRAEVPTPTPDLLRVLQVVADAPAAAPPPPRRSLLHVAANTRGQRRFLSDASPWNRRLGVGAPLAEVPGGGLARYEAGLTSWHPDGANVAIFFATEADPVVAVRWVADTWTPVETGAWSRFGNPPAVEAAIRDAAEDTNPYPGNPYSTQRAELRWDSIPSGLPAEFARWRQPAGRGPLRVRVPAGALPPTDGDGHTVVVQPDGRALEMYAAVLLSSGDWVSQTYSFTDALGGLGTGAENGRRASMVPSYAGVVTDADLAAGRIEHALALLVPAGLLAPDFVPPALAFDSDPDYGGALPMGARLALPAELGPNPAAALGLRTELGRVLARAAQEYGLYVVDRGGEGISIVVQDRPETPALRSPDEAERHDVEAIVAALGWVR